MANKKLNDQPNSAGHIGQKEVFVMKVWILFSCNEWKSRSSMRIRRIFKDTIAGRKKLARYIILSRGDLAVTEISENDIIGTCIYRTPIYINDYMTFGHIESDIVE